MKSFVSLLHISRTSIMCILLPALLNKHAQVSGIKIIVNLFLPFDADEGSYYNAHISQLIFAAVDVATGVAN